MIYYSAIRGVMLPNRVCPKSIMHRQSLYKDHIWRKIDSLVGYILHVIYPDASRAISLSFARCGSSWALALQPSSSIRRWSQLDSSRSIDIKVTPYITSFYSSPRSV